MKHFISTILILAFSLLSNLYATDSIESSTSNIDILETAEVDQQKTSVSVALQKFSTESEALKSTLKNHSSDTLKHQKISEIFEFYLSMVLMHVRFQDYVQSYLEERVCWYHVIGLALAFEAYRTHAASSEGFISQNTQFLSQILESYRKM